MKFMRNFFNVYICVCMTLHQCLTCSVNRWHESEEDGACVGRQRFLYSDQERIEVKLAFCVSYCCHTGLSLHTCTQTEKSGDEQTI